MNIEAYTNPDFGNLQKLIFALVTLAGIVLILIIILISTRISVASYAKHDRKFAYHDMAHNRIQRFFELVISGSSVLSFSCAYVILNHIYTRSFELSGELSPFIRTVISLWGDWRDFILLLLICLSCVLNSILDRFIIPLGRISKNEKATIRMLAMFYCIIILIWLNRIGDESEYNPVMMYYLGLMVGRFVYFDASLADFFVSFKKMFQNLPFLIMSLALAGLLSLFGFRAGYLLERNYYIVGVFYVHLFMLAAVFFIRLIHLPELIIPRPKRPAYSEDVEYDDYTDHAGYTDTAGYNGYTEYDDYGEYDDYSGYSK